MRNRFLSLLILFAMGFWFTSCYTNTFYVGDGPQTGIEVKKMNHYLIYGLAPLNVSDPNELAGGAKDYEVTITHTFIDGLINAITFGIYTPTTTIVKK